LIWFIREGREGREGRERKREREQWFGFGLALDTHVSEGMSGSMDTYVGGRFI
jgi:hypothetical protein